MADIVTVTGASGFIASELVKQLLEKGYHVRATVRSTKSTEKVAHLQKLSEALPGSLELFEADLTKEGSFDAATKGATYVFHTASPFVANWDDPNWLVDTAVTGTTNVLGSVAKDKSIKRVVLTSSCAAILSRNHPPKNGNTYTEEDWNDDAQLEDAYRYSKVQAEKKAWGLAKEHGFDLVTICPSFVVGPVLSSRTDAESVKTLKAIVEGKLNKLRVPINVDVRDVARAHVLAAEIPSAYGRYIVSHGTTVTSKMAFDVLMHRFPEFKLMPPEDSDEKSKEFLDTSKVQRELGLCFRPIAESFVDGVVTLIQVGVAKPQLK